MRGADRSDEGPAGGEEGMAEDIIRRALGESAASLAPLKAAKVYRARQLRRALGERRALPALPYLVTLRDGRRFKLLRGTGSARATVAGLVQLHAVVGGLPCVPRLVAHDAENLLLEWIDGAAPRIDDPAFAAALGRTLAALHGIEANVVERASLVATLDAIVERAMRAQALNQRGAERMRAWYAQLPERVRTSVTYADLKEGNLCWGTNGELVLFDLGSFRRHSVTDEHLFAGKLSSPSLWSRLSHRDAFREAYLAAPGAYPHLFEAQTWLAPLSALRMAGTILDRRDALPVWFWRQRAAYRRSVAERARAVLQAITASGL